MQIFLDFYVGLGATENFYLRFLRWDGHAIIVNIAMSGLTSQIIDIIGVNCAKLRQWCVLGTRVAFAVPKSTLIWYFISFQSTNYSNKLC